MMKHPFTRRFDALYEIDKAVYFWLHRAKMLITFAAIRLKLHQQPKAYMRALTLLTHLSCLLKISRIPAEGSHTDTTQWVWLGYKCHPIGWSERCPYLHTPFRVTKLNAFGDWFFSLVTTSSIYSFERSDTIQIVCTNEHLLSVVCVVLVMTKTSLFDNPWELKSLHQDLLWYRPHTRTNLA